MISVAFAVYSMRTCLYVHYVRSSAVLSRLWQIMARWMRNGERKGTFRYATLNRDRFFSPIRHSAPLMTALVSREERCSSFLPFFFFFFSLKTVTQLVYNNPRLHGAATMNLNYYAQKKFSYLLAREFIARYKLRMILSALYSRRCGSRLYSRFLFFLLSCFSRYL